MELMKYIVGNLKLTNVKRMNIDVRMNNASGLRMGWASPSPAQPSPARPSPAHGLKFFEEKTMGWAGPTHFFGGRPWAKSFGPWFGFLIKYRFNSLSLIDIMKDVCWCK